MLICHRNKNLKTLVHDILPIIPMQCLPADARVRHGIATVSNHLVIQSSLIQYHLFWTGVLDVIQRDVLIQIYALNQLDRLGEGKPRDRDLNVIRTKIRSMARLIIKLESTLGLNSTTMTDYLKPQRYDQVAKAVKLLGSEKSPQLAIALGHYVKQLNLLKIGRGIKLCQEQMVTEGERFMRLYEASWCHTVASSTNKTQRLRKIKKVTELPLTTDIMTLSQYIANQVLTTTESNRLKKIILSGLLLFNKRRPMEVQELTIADFKRAIDRVNDPYTQEIVSNLTKSESAIAKRYGHQYILN